MIMITPHGSTQQMHKYDQ